MQPYNPKILRTSLATKDEAELRQAKEDVASLHKDVAALTQSVQTIVAENVRKETEPAEPKADGHSQWQEILDKLDTLRTEGGYSTAKIEAEVAKQPLGSLGIVFVFGFILAKLLGLGGQH